MNLSTPHGASMSWSETGRRHITPSSTRHKILTHRSWTCAQLHLRRQKPEPSTYSWTRKFPCTYADWHGLRQTKFWVPVQTLGVGDSVDFESDRLKFWLSGAIDLPVQFDMRKSLLGGQWTMDNGHWTLRPLRNLRGRNIVGRVGQVMIVTLASSLTIYWTRHLRTYDAPSLRQIQSEMVRGTRELRDSRLVKAWYATRATANLARYLFFLFSRLTWSSSKTLCLRKGYPLAVHSASSQR